MSASSQVSLFRIFLNHIKFDRAAENCSYLVYTTLLKTCPWRVILWMPL